MGRDGWQGRNSWRESRAREWRREHRSWFDRGGYGGFFIVNDHFMLRFGPRHFFRLERRPVIYMGFPRFEYGGYSFLIVDPWPEDWDDYWYESDDVYVDWDEGYYLYNRRYPDVRLAVTVIR
jgi:hypothetical protein